MRPFPRSSLLLAAAALAAGCATAPIGINYAPTSVLTASGSLSVADFRYPPAEAQGEKPPAVAPNQIRNTAMGSILIDREVRVFVRDAVFAEMRFVGIKPDDQRRALAGAVEEFLADDLGFNVDWTLRVAYTLTDKTSGQLLYQGTKNVQRRTAKFGNPMGALNETVKLNVEELIKDPAFIKAVQ